MTENPNRVQLTRLMIEAMARHLPPSAADLRLLDINGLAGDTLSALRADLEIVPVPGYVDRWPDDQSSANCVDAVVAYAYILNDRFLAQVLHVLRPGGRLVVVDPRGQVNQAAGQRLEAAGYARILVETAVEAPGPAGVLLRGEKPHATGDTLARIQQVAGRDEAGLDLSAYRGRYVHLLIFQAPNKPVWRLQPGETVQWQAVALEHEGEAVMLAFSSLPRAVGFMQPAVLAGKLDGVNKVGKFRRETAAAWSLPVLLNPGPELLEQGAIALIPVDPATAEASDE
jgi:SAM-dependent methyltransferase